MFYVYVLESEKSGSYYIGQTRCIEDRIRRHNNGFVPSTRHKRPWHLVFYEEFSTRGEAAQRELYLKNLKSRIAVARIAEHSF